MTTPSVIPNVAVKPVAPPEAPTTPVKLVAVTFINPVSFGGVSQSVRLGINCDSVTPVVMGSHGWRTVDDGEIAQGVVLRREKYDQVKRAKVVEQSFVPFGNVAELVYG